MIGAEHERATDPTADQPRETSSTLLDPRLAACLAYSLWFISGAAVLAIERKSAFVRFHAAQAVLAFGAFVIWLMALVLFDIPRIPLVGFAVYLASVPAALIAWIVLMAKAYQGKRLSLPVFGRIAARIEAGRFLAPPASTG